MDIGKTVFTILVMLGIATGLTNLFFGLIIESGRMTFIVLPKHGDVFLEIH